MIKHLMPPGVGSFSATRAQGPDADETEALPLLGFCRLNPEDGNRDARDRPIRSLPSQNSGIGQGWKTAFAIPMILSNDLVMIALGIDRDAPALPEQPRLADGIHPRWAFRRERGFPWYGYDGIRRTSEKTAARCLASEWQAASTRLRAPRRSTHRMARCLATRRSRSPTISIRTVSSKSICVGAPGSAWIFRRAKAACQIALTIGFHQVTPVERCIEFLKQTPGALKNPFTLERARFDVYRPDGASLPGARIFKLREVGLDLPPGCVLGPVTDR